MGQCLEYLFFVFKALNFLLGFFFPFLADVLSQLLILTLNFFFLNSFS